MHRKIYKEDPNHTMKGSFLSDEAYLQVLDGLVIVCTDCAIMEHGKKGFWLAKRNVLPMKGLWMIGGRRKAGESPAESMARCFLRETQCAIAPTSSLP